MEIKNIFISLAFVLSSVCMASTINTDANTDTEKVNIYTSPFINGNGEVIKSAILIDKDGNLVEQRNIYKNGKSIADANYYESNSRSSGDCKVCYYLSKAYSPGSRTSLSVNSYARYVVCSIVDGVPSWRSL